VAAPDRNRTGAPGANTAARRRGSCVTGCLSRSRRVATIRGRIRSFRGMDINHLPGIRPGTLFPDRCSKT
jgi:hypothetical protein